MKEKDEKYLQELLENSDIGSSREALKKLAEFMVSYKQFKSCLQQKFEMDDFDSSYVISKIISLWKAFMGQGATLNNFENTTRHLGLKDIAG